MITSLTRSREKYIEASKATTSVTLGHSTRYHLPEVLLPPIVCAILDRAFNCNRPLESHKPNLNHRSMEEGSAGHQFPSYWGDARVSEVEVPNVAPGKVGLLGSLQTYTLQDLCSWWSFSRLIQHNWRRNIHSISYNFMWQWEIWVKGSILPSRWHWMPIWSLTWFSH